MVELRGVVVDFKLRSPHTSFVVDGQLFADDEPQGSVERWEVEWESAPMLQTLGVEPQTFAVGDDVTIVAAPHRDRAFRFVHALSVADAFGDTFVMADSDRLFSPSLRRAAAAVGGETFDGAPAVAARVAAKCGARRDRAKINRGPSRPRRALMPRAIVLVRVSRGLARDDGDGSSDDNDAWGSNPVSCSPIEGGIIHAGHGDRGDHEPGGEDHERVRRT